MGRMPRLWIYWRPKCSGSLAGTVCQLSTDFPGRQKQGSCAR